MAKKTPAALVPTIPKRIPLSARLTPKKKVVLARAIALIKKGHVQHHYMYDAETDKSYDDGWYENGKKPLVCVVGSLQRAAWLELGKPDMSDKKVAKEVEKLADDLNKRVNLFLPDATLIEAETGRSVEYSDVVDFNDADDGWVGAPSKKRVLAVFEAALKPLKK